MLPLPSLVHIHYNTLYNMFSCAEHTRIYFVNYVPYKILLQSQNIPLLMLMGSNWHLPLYYCHKKWYNSTKYFHPHLLPMLPQMPRYCIQSIPILPHKIDRFISAKMESKKMQKSGIFTKIKPSLLIGGLFSAFV